MADDLGVGQLFVPHYDHVRYYTDERLSEWDDAGAEKPVIILLERTVDMLSLKTVMHIGRVLIGDKVRYVYMDDMKIME